MNQQNKRLIIIGNKPCSGQEIINGYNISDFINTFDLVFRVNKCDNYYKTGTRCDNIWFESNSHFMDVFKDTDKINSILKNVSSGNIYCHECWYNNCVNFISKYGFKSLIDKIIKISGDDFKNKISIPNNCVSTLRFIYLILYLEKYKDYDIYIICFDLYRNKSTQYLNSTWHNKNLDQNYISKLLLNDRIYFIDL